MEKRSRGRPKLENKRVTITATVDQETKDKMIKVRQDKKVSFGKQLDRLLCGNNGKPGDKTTIE